jgi:integrase
MVTDRKIMASIRKRTWTAKDGEKTAWIADYFDQSGKRHIKTFKLKKAAEAWLDEAKIEVKRGIHTPANASVTVAEAGDAWIEQAEADGLERSTVEEYRRHLDQHIKPFIGGVRLAEFSPAGVRALRNKLIKEQRSPVMAKKVVSSLGAILANAMADHKVARNVVREQAQHVRRRERGLERRHTKNLEVGINIPTKAEIRAMLDAAQGRWRALFVTAIFTGLRASELRGLRWDDVDLDRGELTVRQRADRWGSIGSPKSDAGKRTVPLAPMVVNALKEWRLACPQGTAGLAFPNNRGSALQLSSIHYRGLAPLQRVAGITEDAKPKYGMHSLRHAAASLFIEQGFSAKRVQALMGHSTIQMTFDTYGHLFPAPEDDQAAMRQLQARLIG